MKNYRTTHRTRNGVSIIALSAALLSLAGCERADGERTVGQHVDEAVATAGQSADSARGDIRHEVAEARQDATRTTADLKERATAAAETVADKLQDAAITATVNAELAKDAQLSAIKIDVDTVAGKVMLQGTAPDADARARAARLASGVRGVTGVENRLEIRS